MSEVKEEQMTLGQKPDDEIKGQAAIDKSKEDKPKDKPADKKKTEKKEEKKEERFKGQLIFVSGPNQQPLNLDQVFSQDKDYQDNGGATKSMIKTVAKKVYLELLDPKVDIVIIEHEKQQYCYLQNTLSKKGFDIFKENGPQIVMVEDHIMFYDIEEYFEYVFEKEKTEARALVYYNTAGNQYLFVVPEEKEKGVAHIVNGVDYCLNGNPNIYLVADFHSHHEMSNKFSSIDDQDEVNKPNILFGTWSFNDGWNFRCWDIKHDCFRYYDNDYVFSANWSTWT